MGFEVMRALRKGQAAIFNLTQDIRGEARIVERAFGLGASALAEAVEIIGEASTSNLLDVWELGQRRRRPRPSLKLQQSPLSCSDHFWKAIICKDRKLSEFSKHVRFIGCHQIGKRLHLFAARIPVSKVEEIFIHIVQSQRQYPVCDPFVQEICLLLFEQKSKLPVNEPAQLGVLLCGEFHRGRLLSSSSISSLTWGSISWLRRDLSALSTCGSDAFSNDSTTAKASDRSGS
jgi:hypothetical protein